MKVGIFGDSFASANMNNTESWIDILSKEYDVTNHALSGSNLYYSMTQLKENHNKYDKNIFVVTQPGRIKIADHVPCPAPRLRYVSHASIISGVTKKTSETSELINAYNAVLDYYKYIQDDEYDKYIHRLMIDDLTKICSNIMLIPAFKNSIPGRKRTSLIDIRTKENNAWGFDYFVPDGYFDIRNCHLTKENNSVLAKKIIESIDSNFLNLNINDFQTPMDKEFYIRNKKL